MKKAIFISFLAIILFPAGKATSYAQIRLFNGQDLDGWYTFLQDRGRDNDPLNVFTVQDGMIRISGEEWGCITTQNEYQNYKILLEFKEDVSIFDTLLEIT